MPMRWADHHCLAVCVCYCIQKSDPFYNPDHSTMEALQNTHFEWILSDSQSPKKTILPPDIMTELNIRDAWPDFTINISEISLILDAPNTVYPLIIRFDIESQPTASHIIIVDQNDQKDRIVLNSATYPSPNAPQDFNTLRQHCQSTYPASQSFKDIIQNQLGQWQDAPDLRFSLGWITYAS